MIETNQQANRVLDALGNQHRRDILAMLRERPRAVKALAMRLPISRPAVSKHLRILQEAGLVAFREEGTHNIFYVEAAGFDEIRHYLDQFWDEALDNFKRLAESDGAN